MDGYFPRLSSHFLTALVIYLLNFDPNSATKHTVNTSVQTFFPVFSLPFKFLIENYFTGGGLILVGRKAETD